MHSRERQYQATVSLGRNVFEFERNFQDAIAAGKRQLELDQARKNAVEEYRNGKYSVKALVQTYQNEINELQKKLERHDGLLTYDPRNHFFYCKHENYKRWGPDYGHEKPEMSYEEEVAKEVLAKKEYEWCQSEYWRLIPFRDDLVDQIVVIETKIREIHKRVGY